MFKALLSSSLIRSAKHAVPLVTTARQARNAVRAVAPLPGVSTVPVRASIRQALQVLASASAQKEPFYLLDVGDVYRKHVTWGKSLPRVEPFYAVKCNSDPMVLKALASLRTGFDCASLVEMQTMLSLGVDPKKIIYAHPCKPPHHIRFAMEHGVELMTFDNEDELEKIQSIYPGAKLVVRVHTDDSKAICKVRPFVPFSLHFHLHHYSSERSLASPPRMPPVSWPRPAPSTWTWSASASTLAVAALMHLHSPRPLPLPVASSMRVLAPATR